MTDDEPKRNKGGRPAKYPGEGRRPSLSLRVRGGLYEKLQEAAEQSERTISEEMEARLLQSFEQASLIEVASQAAADAAIKASKDIFLHSFGNEDNFKFGQAMASALIYAKWAEGLAGVDYKDLKNLGEKYDFIRDYVLKCVVHELESDSRMAGPEHWQATIKANIEASKRGEKWPKKNDFVDPD